MKIIISPYSRQLINESKNAKNYHYWEELTELLKEQEYKIIQIGTKDEITISSSDDLQIDLPLKAIAKLISESDLWISVDNFLPHFCNWKQIETQGIVIFSKSDPEIFGYSQNINIFKDKKYFRENQFITWEEQEYDKNAFIDPREILIAIESLQT